MKTYYLIDYENVGSNGLLGCEKLNKTSHVHIFYTNNSKKIDLDIFYKHGDAKIVIHKVPSGKQSLDLHISSFIGYILGSNIKKNFDCVIISKDTDYDNIIDFWFREKKIKITRMKNISKQERLSDDISNYDKIYKNIKNYLKQNDILKEDIDNILSICKSFANSENKKQDIYKNIIYKYGRIKGVDIYRAIKNLI